MSSWVNRTVLSGSSVDRNGTNSHTCTFTAASAGNLLVVVTAGSLTYTTPTGWTLGKSAVNLSGLYVFAKIASAGESSFSTTHNGSNFPILGVVYEFPAGSKFWTAASETGQAFTRTGPTMGGLGGTYTRFAARSIDANTSGSADCAWTSPTIEDYDASVPRTTTDGIFLSIAYDDGSSGSTFAPTSTVTRNGITTASTEGLVFALSVTTATYATTAWLDQ